MVDPTKGIGPIQQIQSANKPTRVETSKRDTGEVENRADPLDQVDISAEALDASQANEAAQNTRLLLQEDPQAVLSRSGGNFDTLL